MRTVLYPGSFDPVTTGHMDIIRRAAAQFERVIVGVLYNPEKPTGAFPVAERLDLLKTAVADLSNVEVGAYAGLLVDVAASCGADAVIRSLRTAADLDAELQMARLNRQMSGIETLFLASAPEMVHISSSMVRVIGQHGGDIRGLVPELIEERVAKGLKATHENA